jgi:hypothetical protein
VKPFATARLLLTAKASDGHRHIVQFYENDAFIIENVVALVGNDLNEGGASIFAATPPHLEGIATRLSATGLDLEMLRKEGRYVELDAAEMLKWFMVDGWPDVVKFNQVVGGVVASAIEKSATHSATIFGGAVALLCDAKNSAAAIRLEHLWNNLGKRLDFSLCCAYPLSSFEKDPDGRAFFQICAAHSLVIPAETPL